MKYYYTLLLTLGLSLISPAAMAHDNHFAYSLLSGFTHVMTGPDHLLALLLAGVLIGRLKTKKILAGSFVLFALSTGAIITLLLNFNDSSVLQTGWIELAVLLSIPVFISLLVIQKTTQTLTLSMLSLFMFVHGMAHGIELSSFSNSHFLINYLPGLLLTSLLLICVTSLVTVKLTTTFTRLKHV